MPFLSDNIPFVSVVLPCYNGRRTLGSCLASLEGQSYPRDRFEVIVADNGSTDGSQALIAAEYPRVRLVEATRKGSGYARNAGMAAAAGEILLSIDSDCVADRAWITTMVEAFRTAPANTGAIAGAIVPYSERTFVERYREAWISQPGLKDATAKIRYAATPNAAFSAKAFREVGGFDGTLGFDDTDLGIRMAAAGYAIGYTAAAVVRHRNPVTMREMYRHRLKYGHFGFTLARKHPLLYGEPMSRTKQRTLLLETLWRMAKDAVKLPVFVAFRSEGRPRGWPLLDALLAWANYRGFRHAMRLQSKL